MSKVILAFLNKVVTVQMLVVVTMCLASASILESVDRSSTNTRIGQALNIDPELFAVSMILGATFIFLRYVIANTDIRGWKETLYYAVALLPLSYYALFTGIYSLTYSQTKTGAIFILALWGFLLIEPIVRRKNHE